MPLMWRFCPDDDPSINATEARVRVAQSQPTVLKGAIEKVPDIDIVAPDAGIDRSGVNHSVFVAGIDVSVFVEEISIREKLNEDTEVKIKLDNFQFTLTGAYQAILVEGSSVGVELFDGVRWTDFGVGTTKQKSEKGEKAQLVISEIEREYEDAGKVHLVCRSSQIKFQLREKAHRWTKKRDSDVVTEIAVQNGLVPDVQQTEFVYDETAQSKEPTATFLNRLARRNQFEWRIEGNSLYFHPLKAVKTNIKLFYRPGSSISEAGGMGTVTSARARRESDSQKGEGAKADIPSIDFAEGLLDQDTLASLGVENVGQLLSNEPVTAANNSLASQQRSTARQDTSDGGGKKVTVRVDNTTGTISFPKNIEMSPGSLKKDNSSAEARAVAAGVENNNAFEFLLDLTTYGMGDLRIRRIVEVAGLSELDDGKWLIQEAEHTYNSDGAYKTRLSMTASLKKGAVTNAGGAGSADGKGAQVQPIKEVEELVVGRGRGPNAGRIFTRKVAAQ